MKTFLVTIALLLVSSASSAEYGVQIGAYAESAGAAMEQAADVGPIVSWQSGQGLTLYAVTMVDQEAALRAVPVLRNLGYEDAFVKELPVHVTGSHLPSASTGRVLADRDSPTEHLEVLARLSPAEREQLVYLDGRPHLKNGNVFTPVR